MLPQSRMNRNDGTMTEMTRRLPLVSCCHISCDLIKWVQLAYILFLLRVRKEEKYEVRHLTYDQIQPKYPIQSAVYNERANGDLQENIPDGNAAALHDPSISCNGRVVLTKGAKKRLQGFLDQGDECGL
jgi:hypothetical protein